MPQPPEEAAGASFEPARDRLNTTPPPEGENMSEDTPTRDEIRTIVLWSAGALLLKLPVLRQPETMAIAYRHHRMLRERLDAEHHSALDLALECLTVWTGSLPKEHVCLDYMCAECGTDKILTRVEVAERNLREVEAGVNIFHETPEELERQCQEWRAVIAKKNTRTDDSEFTQADERAMEAAMHDTLMAEEDSRRAFIRSQVAGPCLCPPNSTIRICGPCQKWEEYCS
jgi:hypothetical protein